MFAMIRPLINLRGVLRWWLCDNAVWVAISAGMFYLTGYQYPQFLFISGIQGCIPWLTLMILAVFQITDIVVTPFELITVELRMGSRKRCWLVKAANYAVCLLLLLSPQLLLLVYYGCGFLPLLYTALIYVAVNCAVNIPNRSDGLFIVNFIILLIMAVWPAFTDMNSTGAAMKRRLFFSVVLALGIITVNMSSRFGQRKK